MSGTTDGLTDDEIVGFLNESRSLSREASEHQGMLRAQRKRGIAAGMNRRAWAMALRGLKASDPEGVVAMYRDAIRYMTLLRLPITAEDLFGGALPQVANSTRVGMDIWDAQDSGHKVGRAGGDRAENPYEAGSELHVEWDAWWIKGQESIAREMGPDTELPASARTPRKRGRPPGAKNKPKLRLEVAA